MGIPGGAVDVDLEVEVGPGARSGAAHQADDLAPGDGPARHRLLAQVGVPRLHAVPVVDDGADAVAGAARRVDDGARPGGEDRVACLAVDVEALVVVIAVHPEPADQLAGDRPEHRWPARAPAPVLAPVPARSRGSSRGWRRRAPPTPVGRTGAVLAYQRERQRRQLNDEAVEEGEEGVDLGGGRRGAGSSDGAGADGTGCAGSPEGAGTDGTGCAGRPGCVCRPGCAGSPICAGGTASGAAPSDPPALLSPGHEVSAARPLR